MNKLDKQYQDLLQDILDNGVEKKDRTNTGTISVFGRQIRHKMSEGFPLLTTKKMAWKTMVTELLWFLKGDTNIKYLVDNGCNIWNGDAYKKYENSYAAWKYDSTWSNNGEPWDMENFIRLIKTDERFCSMFGELGPIYGKQWREWNNYVIKPGLVSRPDGLYNENYLDYDQPIDQIQKLINDLKTNPDSRRLMVNAWNVGELDQMVLPPCHYSWQVYTRELTWEERSQLLDTTNGPWDSIAAIGTEMDKQNLPKRAISLMYNARSQDVPLGTPFNISSYALLLVIIGKMVNMVPDELITNMGDCHIYLNQIDGVREQITREPFELPKLLCKDEFHYLMDEKITGNISFDEKINQFKPDFFKLENYQSHPTIKMPLSN